MCGIVVVKNLSNGNKVNNLVEGLYDHQRLRGTEGFGFVGLSKRQIKTFRHTAEKGFKRQLRKNKFDEILLHHRYPTSTDNDLISTHPFEIKHEGKLYYFIHNGMLYNDDMLQVSHYAQGIKYTSMHDDGSFNDSEALAWDFVLYHSGEQEIMRSIGGVAFICIVVDQLTNKAEKMYFYKNYTQPLTMYRDKFNLIISSESNIENAEDVKANRLYYYDYETKNVIRQENLFIETYVRSVSNYGHGHEWNGGYGDDARDIRDFGQSRLTMGRNYKKASNAELSRAMENQSKINDMEVEIENLEGERYWVDGEVNTLFTKGKFDEAEDLMERFDEIGIEIKRLKAEVLDLDMIINM